MTKRATKLAAVMSLALIMLIGANCFAAVKPYFLAAGSSGAFNSFALAAGPAEGGGICGQNIWTYKNGAQGVDNRGTGLLETGNVWIVWNNSTTPTIVCAYIAVDSIIGQQLFFAQPASTFNCLEPAGTAGMNLIPTLTDTPLPAAVLKVLQGQAFNAAPSDIRPEDALFEETRVLAALNTTNYDGLGYGPGPVGTPILSHFSTKSSTPALYALSGTDPITGQAIPAHKTTNVGTQVVVVAVNAQQGSAQNSGHFGDSTSFFSINRRDLTLALNGGYAYTKDLTSIPGQGTVPLNVITREPLFWNLHYHRVQRPAKPGDRFDPGGRRESSDGPGYNLPRSTLRQSAEHLQRRRVPLESNHQRRRTLRARISLHRGLYRLWLLERRQFCGPVAEPPIPSCRRG